MELFFLFKYVLHKTTPMEDWMWTDWLNRFLDRPLGPVPTNRYMHVKFWNTHPLNFSHLWMKPRLNVRIDTVTATATTMITVTAMPMPMLRRLVHIPSGRQDSVSPIGPVVCCQWDVARSRAFIHGEGAGALADLLAVIYTYVRNRP